MNKRIKITLLVAAILVAFGGVMAYYKTIVSPPSKLEFKNQFIEADKKDIYKVKSADTEFALDTVYTSIIDGLKIQLKNDFISPDEKDELLRSFVAQYIPQYVSFCKTVFNQSAWSESTLKKMTSRISDIQSLKSTNGEIIVSDELSYSLNEVRNVVINYHDAKSIARVAGYHGLSDARLIIETARRYADMSPLNNCSQLVSDLNSVPSRLNDAHYDYLVHQVERLRYWSNYSEYDYERLAESISKQLMEYKDQAHSVYGYSYNISDLQQRASSYYNNSGF